jgi:hypothetical protein
MLLSYWASLKDMRLFVHKSAQELPRIQRSPLNEKSRINIVKVEPSEIECRSTSSHILDKTLYSMAQMKGEKLIPSAFQSLVS